MEYIRIPTQLLQSYQWRYELDDCSKLFFFDLLMRATYSRSEFLFMNEIYNLEAGQLVTTQRSLAKSLCIKDSKVRYMMSKLVEFGLIKTEITQSTRNKHAMDIKARRTIITICERHYYIGTLSSLDDDLCSYEGSKNSAIYKEIEEIEYIKTKGGSQKEPIQEEDMVELLSSHPRHSESLYFDGWIESLKDQLNLPKDTIVDQIRIFAKHKEVEGNKRLPISIFRHYCRLFIKEKFPNQKSKYNARQERQPERIYNRLPNVEDLPEFQNAFRNRYKAIADSSNDGVEPSR